MAYVPPSDWELKDFIRDHADAVYRSCGFLTLGRGDSGEMTREIFLKILNRGMEFRSEQEARAWMILTAYQMGRKVSKDAPVSEQGKELQKLKRKDRLVALLYYCEGYRKKEIADYLGCTEASVRRRLARVKRRLAVEEPEDTAREEAEEAEITEDGFTVEEAAAEEVSGEQAPAEEKAPEEESTEQTPGQVAAAEETTEEATAEEEGAEEPPSDEIAGQEPEKGGEAEC